MLIPSIALQVLLSTEPVTIPENNFKHEIKISSGVVFTQSDEYIRYLKNLRQKILRNIMREMPRFEIER